MPPMVPLSENVIPREEAMKLWAELDAMGTMVVEGFYGFTMGRTPLSLSAAVTAAVVAA